MTELVAREQYEAFAKVLEDGGMDARAPWECSLDDLEQERFDTFQKGLAAAISAGASEKPAKLSMWQALTLIARHGCHHTSSQGPGACFKNGRVPGAQYSADGCCDGCIAHAALNNDPFRPQPIASVPREPSLELLLLSYQKQPDGTVLLSIHNGCWVPEANNFGLGQPGSIVSREVGDGCATHWLPRSAIADPDPSEFLPPVAFDPGALP